MLIALALLFGLPSLALIAFGVAVDHSRRQREKRSRQVRAELIAREEDRRQEIQVIGSGRTAPDLFADRWAAR